VGIPFLLVVTLLVVAGIIAAVVIKRRQWGNDNWEISPNELEMEDHLGTGGYAHFHASLPLSPITALRRALWLTVVGG
jgi:hypothetical protein